MEALPPPPEWCEKGIASPKGVANISVLAVLFAIYCPIIALRAYARITYNGVGWDDAAIFAAFLFITAVTGIAWYSTYLGLGHHIVCVPFENISRIILFEFVDQVLLIFSIMMSRISIALFFIRVFVVSRKVKYWLYGFTAFMAAVNIATAATTIPQCHPTEKLWNPFLPGHCWSQNVGVDISAFNGAVSVVCDLVLAALPIFFVWDVQMPFQTKVVVCVLMGMGVFTAVCALVRSIMLKYTFSSDITYDLVDLGIFAMLESAVAIIAACLPTLKNLITKEKQRTAASRQRLVPAYARSSETKSNTSKAPSSWSNPAVLLRNMRNKGSSKGAASSLDSSSQEGNRLRAEAGDGIGKRIDVDVILAHRDD